MRGTSRRNRHHKNRRHTRGRGRGPQVGGDREDSTATEGFVASFFQQQSMTPTGEETMDVGNANSVEKETPVSIETPQETDVSKAEPSDSGDLLGNITSAAMSLMPSGTTDAEDTEIGGDAEDMEAGGDEMEGGNEDTEAEDDDDTEGDDDGGVLGTMASAAMSLMPSGGDDADEPDEPDEQDTVPASAEKVKHLQKLHGIADEDISTDMSKVTTKPSIRDGTYTRDVNAGEVALVLALVFNPMKTGILVTSDADMMDGYGKDDAVMNSHTEMRKMWVELPGVDGVCLNMNAVVVVPSAPVKEGERVVLSAPLSIRIRRGVLENVTGYVSTDSLNGDENITVVDETV